MNWQPRRQGKSQAIKLATEAALNVGKKVALASPDGWLILKRYGKLTSITPCKPEPIKFWHDDLEDI